MVQKRYSKEIQDELQKRTVSKAYEKVQKDSGLDILEVVELENQDSPVDPKVDLHLNFIVDLKPQFEIPHYQGLTLKKGPTTATDDELDAEIQNLLSQHADFVPIDGPGKKGDYAKCSYHGSLDGTPVSELLPDHPIYGTQNNTWEEVGAEASPGISSLIEALVGMSAGSSTTLEHHFPDDFPHPELQGKTVAYTLEVHEVRERQFPEFNEEFAKLLEYESTDDLKAATREKLENQKRNLNSSLMRKQVMERLDANSSFDLPESLVETRTQQVLVEFISDRIRQGAEQKDFEAHKDQLFESAEQAARKRIKLDFIFAKIAEKENVTVTEEDFSRYIYSRALQTRKKPQDIVKELQEDRRSIEEIRRNILAEKTIVKIVEQADQQELSAEEFEQFTRSPGA